MDKAGYLALVFFGLLAFCNAIRHPFVHDDVVFILNNPHITKLESWAEAFKAPSTPDGINTYYRPVLEVLYRLEYHFFGPCPFGYHLFNVIVHIINGLLLFGLLRAIASVRRTTASDCECRLIRRSVGYDDHEEQKLNFVKHTAWVTALLFLIHPVQTEAVSCISGISNLWMTLGILLALHAYLKKWYTATLLCFAAAFLSKEQAVMLVPLVVVIDYSRGDKNVRSWFFLGLFACILLWLRQSVTGTSLLKDIMVSRGELYLRVIAVPGDIGMYLRLIFCPYDLHYYRSTDILQSGGVAWILALISVGGIFYALHRWPQARSTLILGFGWFLAALFPVLNIVPLVNEYSFILTPEHFLYLPIVGILIVVVSAADYFIDKSRDRHYFLLKKSVSVPAFIKRGLGGVVIGVCLLLTWHQNTFWKSEIVLFGRMLDFEPNFGRGHLLLAKAYYFNGRPQDADEHFEKAFTIISGYAKKASNLTAKNFYLRLEKEILDDWAWNDYTASQARRD